MTTAYLALRGFAKSPLIPQRWGAVMGSFNAKEWILTGCALATFGLVAGGTVFGAGGFMSGQSKDVANLQGQYQTLQAQYQDMTTKMAALKDQVAPLSQVPVLIARLNDRLDQAPRTDLLDSRLLEIQRHLSALDGRSDATETRMRADEDRVIRDDTRLDAIEGASKATLGNHR